MVHKMRLDNAASPLPDKEDGTLMVHDSHLGRIHIATAAYSLEILSLHW